MSDSVGASTRLLTGKCLCGAVGYEVVDDFEYAMNCHCSNSRRTTGSAFKPFAGIKRNQLRLVRCDKPVRIFGDEQAAHNVNCSACGSLLYSVVREGAYVHVTMGTLVDEPRIRPSEHIFVGSKALWYEITDDLPQYEAFADR